MQCYILIVEAYLFFFFLTQSYPYQLALIFPKASAGGGQVHVLSIWSNYSSLKLNFFKSILAICMNPYNEGSVALMTTKKKKKGFLISESMFPSQTQQHNEIRE